jgi:hypothetical protein
MQQALATFCSSVDTAKQNINTKIRRLRDYGSPDAHAKNENPPSSTVIANAPSPAPPPSAATKYYSQADKEKLSDLYGELSQLLLSNGANGTGDGVYGAAAALSNEWGRQVGTSPGNLDLDKLNAEAQALQISMRDFYNALYGQAAIPKKAQYLPYSDELRAVLQDDKGTRPIDMLSTAAAGFNLVLEAVGKAGADPGRVEVVVRLSTSNVTSFANTLHTFQKWEFDANQRAQAAKKAL